MRNLGTLTFAFFIFLWSDGIYAQPGHDTKWAIGWTANAFVSPILTSNNSGHSPHTNMGGFTLWGEYYLPDRWNVTAGYYTTEVEYGSLERVMQGVHLGVKKYFVNPDFFLQPYASVAPRINWNAYHDWQEYGYYRNNELVREGRADFRNPRITCHVGAGVELYLFSSVAFVAEYNLGMGISGKTNIQEYPVHAAPVVMTDRGFYHHVSVGVKVTFPFRFTHDDGVALMQSILNSLLD